MKKKLLFLMTLLAVSLLALAEMTVYVYKKDGTKVPYVASTVDSIGFVDVNHFAEGHEWVDLGLPSGTKWATCNVGADSPEEYGDYFAWGETTAKYSYTSYNYTYSGAPTTLPLRSDAANVNWEGDWRLPTIAEQAELIRECTWNLGEMNGVNGYTVIGPNGNSIFFPGAGNYQTSNVEASYGYYWSSSVDTEYSSDAYYIFFNSSFLLVDSGTRYIGRSIRPVLGE